jgi:hypothetical protein
LSCRDFILAARRTPTPSGACAFREPSWGASAARPAANRKTLQGDYRLFELGFFLFQVVQDFGYIDHTSPPGLQESKMAGAA